MSLNRLPVAIVGAGMGSAPHFRSLDDLAGEIDVRWVASRDPARLAAVALPAGARATVRLDDVLEDPQVKAVVVLTPPSAHLEVVRRVAQAGKHVLVEKPLEIDLPHAVELVECCEAAGVSLGVMLQHRLRDGALHLARLLAEGRLGRLTGVQASVRWWRPQDYYDVPGRGTLARDGGGVLMTQAIHTLDLLLTLCGEPEQVTGAITTSAAHSMECEDTATALLHYAGGMLGVVHATTAAPPGYPEVIAIDGTLGSATLESGELRVRYADGRTEHAGASVGTGGGADPMGFDHAPHRAVLRDFFLAVSAGRTPAVTGRSALAVHRLIAAIVESSRRGARVAPGFLASS
ncbi:MAG: Gfo/Idh/MocA family oxidoreductase [Burkholderiales bacterium]|nr:Gfo/Idh/MocA family oxidoreductase [Burkholderiales bacterium]